MFTVDAKKNTNYDDRETSLCKAKGYLTLYFFLVNNLIKPKMVKSDKIRF